LHKNILTVSGNLSGGYTYWLLTT